MSLVASMPAWLEACRTSNADEPAWLTILREQQWQQFIKYGVPTRKNERWKYTDLTFLSEDKTLATPIYDLNQIKSTIEHHRLAGAAQLVLVNGYYMPELSDRSHLPLELIVCSLQEAMQQHEALLQTHMMKNDMLTNHPFAQLNSATFNTGLMIYLPEGLKVTRPIQLLSIATETKAFITQPQQYIILENNSQLTLLEESISITSTSYFMNNKTTIHAGKLSQLERYKIQCENEFALHLANTFVFQQQQSQVTLAHFSLGARFARDDVSVQLQETGAHCQASGFYYLNRNDQYIDHHLDIKHQAPHTSSVMNYKGVLDKKSRAVFNGALYINQGTKKIEAHQQNHNLLLSNSAEVYSKPELEIYADDVKCKHGATTGQLDEDALFYLQARGIKRNDAIKMMLSAFANEIVQQVSADVRSYIENRVQNLC